MDAGNAPLVAVQADAQRHPVHGVPRRDTSVAEHAIAGPMTDHRRMPRVFPEQTYGLVEP
jgi:hypothetical protein